MSDGDNFRSGFTQQGQALGSFPYNVSLNADGIVVNPLKNPFIRISSNNTTASNRTFTLVNGYVQGQQLSLVLVTGASTTCELANSGNVALTAAWTPLQNEMLSLQWDANQAKWIEVSRSAQDSNAAIATLQSDVDALETDVGTLQTDVSTLQSDVSDAEADISQLQSDVTALQASEGAAGPYTPGDGADWVDPDPTTIQQALDRIAAAVEGLLTSPIP